MDSRRSACVVGVAAVMVLSMVAPVAGAAGSPAADEYRGETSLDTAQPGGTGADASTAAAGPSASGPEHSVAHRIEAVRALQEASFPGNSDHRRAAALEDLNTSFEYYTDVNRSASVDVFRLDRSVSAQTQRHAPEVADRLAAADAVLAETAVADGERARAALENRSLSYDRDAVSRALDRARHHLDTGDEHRENERYVGAVAHYEHAWVQAQYALAVMNADVDPQVELANHADPVHNGSATYSLQGTVFTVRPDAVENVTVAVDGVETSVPVVPAEKPGTNASFGATVALNGTVNEIRISASATGEGVEWYDPDDAPADDDGVPEPPERDDPRTSTVILELDADGLTDREERQITGTDPLDADSASSRTAADESDNGVVDAEEDFDGDGLPASVELAEGTDPFDADTDGDGLEDAVELSVTRTDPLDADSDSSRTDLDESDDGVVDAAEDFDGDGIATAVELELGSDPFLEDGDGDGVADAVERELGTDPIDPDSDDDGLQDGTELAAQFETDPLDPDTDDDGVLDGDETYTSTVTDAEIGVTVDATGTGNVAEGIDVVDVEQDGDRGFREAPVVRLTNESGFDEARVTFDLDDLDGEAADDPANLSLYTWEPGSDEGWIPVETSVDVENGTASATVEHFSYFSVFYVPAWEETMTDVVTLEDDAEDGEAVDRVDAMLVIDESGSMGGDRIHFAKIASKRFVGSLFDDESVGLVSYASSGYLREGLTTDHDAVNASIDAVSAGGGTNSGDGLLTALAELDANGNADRPAEVILLSDGHTSGPDPVAIAEDADDHVTINTIALGYGANEDEMEAIADATGGDFYHVADESDLPDTFERVAENRSSLPDTDGDGIPDAVENASLTLPGGDRPGQPIALDYADNDTDGDGLADGEELTDYRMVEVDDSSADNATRYRVRVTSAVANPSREDTDRDDLGDATEVEGWSVDVVTDSAGEPYRYDYDGEEPWATMDVNASARVRDTDADGLPDDQEYEINTDPRERITYGITEEHQTEIVDAWANEWDDESDHRSGITQSAQAVGLLYDFQSGAELSEIDLDDGTDSFDFVRPSDGRSGVADELTFKSLDYVPDDNEVERSDVWLSTAYEVQVAGTDPWDPDTDDDGLTDGHELRGLTEAGTAYEETRRGVRVGRYTTIESDRELSTDPLDPDTDGDGYWDGWIGVYDVGHSENVVLYMEHLQNGGVSGDEAVPEQAEVHRVRTASDWDPGRPPLTPYSSAAQLYDDGWLYHSNIHVGELQWGADPTDTTAVPSPAVTIEVDFYEGANTSDIDTRAWERGIERNYAMYDINVDVVRDDTLTDDDLTADFGLTVIPEGGFGGTQVIDTRRFESTVDADEYVIVGHRAGGVFLGENQTGVNIPADPAQALFTDPMETTQIPSDAINRSPYGSSVAMYAAKTQIHEIGHSIAAGEADDRSALEDPGLTIQRLGEIYSGSLVSGTTDPTIERMNGERRWSIMSSGWNSDLNAKPMDGYYFAYSIEELSTVSEP